MLTESDQRNAEELRARLLEHLEGRVRQIILYGSRARGTASPESDFDVLVIEAEPVFKWDEMRHLRQVMHDLPHPVDVWVMGEREFEETKNVIGDPAYPAYKYGIVLYEDA